MNSQFLPSQPRLSLSIPAQPPRISALSRAGSSPRIPIPSRSSMGSMIGMPIPFPTPVPSDPSLGMWKLPVPFARCSGIPWNKGQSPDPSFFPQNRAQGQALAPLPHTPAAQDCTESLGKRPEKGMRGAPRVWGITAKNWEKMGSRGTPGIYIPRRVGGRGPGDSGIGSGNSYPAQG